MKCICQQAVLGGPTLYIFLHFCHIWQRYPKKLPTTVKTCHIPSFSICAIESIPFTSAFTLSSIENQVGTNALWEGYNHNVFRHSVLPNSMDDSSIQFREPAFIVNARGLPHLPTILCVGGREKEKKRKQASRSMYFYTNSFSLVHSCYILGDERTL